MCPSPRTINTPKFSNIYRLSSISLPTCTIKEPICAILKQLMFTLSLKQISKGPKNHLKKTNKQQTNNQKSQVQKIFHPPSILAGAWGTAGCPGGRSPPVPPPRSCSATPAPPAPATGAPRHRWRARSPAHRPRRSPLRRSDGWHVIAIENGHRNSGFSH